MRRILLAVFLLNVLLLSSTVQAGFGENFLRLFRPQENSDESSSSSSSSSEEVGVKTKVETSVDVSSIVRSIWTILQDLFKTHVLEIEKKAVNILRHETKLLSFHKNKFNLLKLKLSDLKSKKSDSLNRLKYCIPLFRSLEEFYSSKKAEEGEANLLAYYSFAHQVISEILTLLEESSSNKEVFSTENETKEWEIILSAKFELNIKAGDLHTIYEKLESLKSKRASIKGNNVKNKSKTKTSMKYFLTSLKIWTLTQEIIYSLVFSINMKTTTSTECEKKFISFYGEDYPFFALKLNELGTDKETCENAIIYMIPILKQIGLFYYSSLTIYRSKTERQDSTEVKFYSFAYHNVAEILSILQSGSSNQSIFSVKSAQKERELIRTGIFIKINESDLNKIWQKLKLLRENQSSFTTSKHKKVKISNANQSTRPTSHLTQTSQYLQTTYKIWILISQFIQTVIHSIETKTTFFECETKFLDFYNNQFPYFVNFFKKLQTGEGNYHSPIKQVIPAVKNLRNFFKSISEKNISTLSMSNQYNLIKFHTMAYKTFSDILAYLEKRCSNKSIFTEESIDDDIRILSATDFEINIQATDLQTIYAHLTTLEEKLTKENYYKSHLKHVVKSEISSSAAIPYLSNSTKTEKEIVPINRHKDSNFGKNIYLLTERLFVSLVNSIQTKKSIACEYDAKLLQFYSEHSQFFASKLKEVLTLKNDSSQSVLKWIFPLVKRMTTYYYTASRETTTTTTTATTSVTNESAVTSFYSYAYAKLTTILTVLQEKCSDKTIFSTETFSEESKLLSSSAFTLTLQTEDLQEIQETLSTVRRRQSGIFADTNIPIPGVEMKGLISGSEGLTGSSEALISTSSTQSLSSFSKNIYLLTERLFVSLVNSIQTKKSIACEYDAKLLQFYSEHSQFFASKLKEVLTLKNDSSQSVLKWIFPLVKRMTTYYYTASRETTTTTTTATTSVTNESAVTSFYSYAYAKLTTILTVLQEKCSDKTIFSTETFSEESKLLSSSAFTLTLQTEDLQEIQETLSTVRRRQSGIFADTNIPIPGVEMKGLISGSEGLTGSSEALISTSSTQSLSSFSKNIYLLTERLFVSLVNSIQTKKSIACEYDAKLLQFYSEHSQFFASKLKEVLTLKNDSSQSVLKWIFPLVKRMTTYYYTASRETTTTTTTATTSVTNESAVTSFYSYAYAKLTTILTVLQEKCSDKTIFSTETFSEESKLLSSSAFTLTLQTEDLQEIQETLSTVRRRQSGIFADTNIPIPGVEMKGLISGSEGLTGSSEALISTSSTQSLSSFSKNIYLLTERLFVSLVNSIQTKKSIACEYDAKLLQFYSEHSQFFASKLKEVLTLKNDSSQSVLKWIFPLVKRMTTYYYTASRETTTTTTTATTSVTNESAVTSFYSYAYAKLTTILTVLQEKCSDKTIFSTETFSEESKLLSSSAFTLTLQTEDLQEIQETLSTVRRRQSGIFADTNIPIPGVEMKGLISGSEGLTGSSEALISTSSTQSLSSFSKNIYLLTERLFVSLVNSIQTKKSIACEYDAKLLQFYSEHSQFFASKLKEVLTLKNDSSQSVLKWIFPLVKRMTTYYYTASRETTTTTTTATTSVTNESAVTSFYSYAYAKLTTILTVLQEKCSDKTIFSTETFSEESKLLSSSAFTLTLQTEDLQEIQETLSTVRRRQSGIFADTNIPIPGVEMKGLISGSEGLTGSSEALISTSSTQSLSSFSKNIYLLTERLFVSLVNSIQTKKSIACEYDAKLLQFYSEHSQFFASKLKEVLTLKNDSSQSVLKWIFPLVKRMTTYYYTASRETTTTTTTATTSVTNESAVTSFYSYAYAKLTTILTVLQEKCSDKTIFSTETFSEESKLLSSSAFTLTLQTEDLQEIQETLSTVRRRQSGIFADTNIPIPGVEMKGLISGSEGRPLANGTMSASFNNESVLSNTTSSMYVGTRFENASKSWKTVNGTSAFVDKMTGNLQILQKYYCDELGILVDYDGEKIGSSIATVKINGTPLLNFFKRIVSYHEKYVGMTKSRSDSVVQLLKFLRFDRKVQGVLFDMIKEFLEWKTHVADFFVAHNVSEMCLTECVLQT
nr:PREDICTED: uncharacterized protein LOC109036609 [Bemisia tabaci]